MTKHILAVLTVLTLAIGISLGTVQAAPTARNADLATVGQVGGQAYALFVAGGYAYVGSGPSFSIYSLSNPTQPERIGYAMLPEKVLGVQVAGNYAYVVTESRFYVFSIADKNHPVEVGSCAISGTGQDLYVKGNYAYVATWTAGLQTVSIADPAHPSVVNTDSAGSSRKVYVSDNYAYVAANQGLYIFSLADPGNPEQISTYVPSDGSAVWDVYVVGQYAYAVGSKWLWIINVSNPATPTLTGSTDQLDFASGVTIDGDYAYIEGYFGDLFVVSIATPANPVVVHSSEQPGNQGTSCAVNGDVLYLANSAGIIIFSITNPNNPIFERISGQPGEAWEVFVHNGYAYVRTDTDEDHDYIDIISLNDPTAPVWQNAWSKDTWDISAIHLSGDYLYVAYYQANTEAGIQILSLTDPAHPTEMGRIAINDISLSISALFASGDYLYLATHKGIKIVSIADKSNPKLSGSYTTNVDEPIDIYVSEQYAYVIDKRDTSDNRPARLKILSLANPTNPVLVGSCDTPGYAHTVFKTGNYAYITDSSDGLLIVDVSNPTTPTQVGNYNTHGQAEHVYVWNSYAFVADGTDGLRMVSVADPTAPTEIDYYDTGVSSATFADAQFVYLADRMSGLVLLTYESPVISGQVTDTDGNPLANIRISAGETYSATTASNGVYTMTVPAGSYTLTPLTAGYLWEPSTRSVVAMGNTDNQDFTGRNIVKSGTRSGTDPAVAYGETITYTIHVVYPQDGTRIFYDPIPTTTIYISNSLNAPAGVIYDTAQSAITGSLTLTAGISQTITFSVRVAITGTAENAPPVTNRACVYPSGETTAACLWSNSVTYASYLSTVYLPVIMRNQ